MFLASLKFIRLLRVVFSSQQDVTEGVDLATEREHVSWRRRAQSKQLAWPMAERQIGYRKSSLVLSARFPVVKWRSRSVAKSPYKNDSK